MSWDDSPEYKEALGEYYGRVLLLTEEELNALDELPTFELSQEFANARHRYRLRINKYSR